MLTAVKSLSVRLFGRIDPIVLARSLAKGLPVLVLMVLLGAQAWGLTVWLQAHVLPNGYQNEIFHLGNALDLFSALRQHDLRLVHDLLFTQYWPPLHYLSAFPFLSFGIERDHFVYSNLFFLLLLLYTVYRLGSRLESRGAGVLAAVLVSLFPAIYGNLRHFEPNVPLTALVSLSLWWLLLSHRFAHRRYSVLFGLAVGLTMMVDRISGAFFVVLPAGLELLIALSQERWSVRTRALSPRARQLLLHLGLAVLMSLVVCGYFYFNFFRLYTEEILPQAVAGEILSTGEQSEFRAPFALTTLLFYPNTLLDGQVGFGLGLLMLPGLVMSLFRSDRRLRLLWIWLLTPLMLFTIIQKKQLYYTIPILPAFALLSSIGMVRWLEGRLRLGRVGEGLSLRLPGLLSIAGVLLIGCHQYALTSFNRPILPERVMLPVGRPVLLDLSWLGGRSPFPVEWVSPRYPQSWPPVRDDLRVPEILAGLQDVRGTLPAFRVETFSEDSFFFEGYLTFFIRCAHPDAIVNGLIQNPQGFYENLRLMDAFVYITNGRRTFPTPESIQSLVVSRGQMKDFEGLPITSVLLGAESRLELKSTLPLGNGATAYVYGLKPWSAGGPPSNVQRPLQEQGTPSGGSLEWKSPTPAPSKPAPTDTSATSPATSSATSPAPATPASASSGPTTSAP